MGAKAKGYAQRFVDSVKAGQSNAFLQGVLNGTEVIDSPEKAKRLETAIWAHNKLIPNPPQGTFEIEERKIPAFIVDYGSD